MFKRNNSQVSNDMSVCLLGIYTGGIWTQVGTLTQQLQVEAAMVDVIWRRDTAAAPPSPEIRPLYFYLRTCTFLLPSVIDAIYLYAMYYSLFVTHVHTTHRFSISTCTCIIV